MASSRFVRDARGCCAPSAGAVLQEVDPTVRTKDLPEVGARPGSARTCWHLRKYEKRPFGVRNVGLSLLHSGEAHTPGTVVGRTQWLTPTNVYPISVTKNFFG